ncbi:MAG: ABC transporter ATP-binding protein [Verrucomicrobia bacterium]|nr:ABC transporter ATP-binding protein [Verrucomicrobiota bacterium]
MARVRIENLTKVFKERKGREICAVNNANLTVEDKELLVLVGPSGCGKTTTLRLIAGLEEITRGTISIDDEVMNDMSPKDRDVAMVFQNHALYPHMTVYENMAFGLKLRKHPKAEIEHRVKEAAEILGLTAWLDSLPKALSGGERQRVAVGRAMVRKPRVFLFDEPLSNLDTQMRVQMRAEIVKLQARLAATMIYVTHDQGEAMSMGDRIAVMRNGVIQQVDEPMNIYHHPANLFVAGFIGSPPMNVFCGEIAQAGNGLCFREQHSQIPAPDNFTVQLDDVMSPKLSNYIGKKIVFGIRPENIVDKLHAREAPPERIVDASVEIIEPMGSETYIYLTTGSHSFIARVNATDRVAVKQKTSLVFDTRSAHFFDPTTGKAIV